VEQPAEKGAKLRVLRWSRFVQGDIDQYMKNVQAFTAKYGIEVRVDSESWEDVRRRRRSRPTPAPDRTSFSAPTTMPISIPRSWWTSPTFATISARSTAAGTRPASSISSRRQALDRRAARRDRQHDGHRESQVKAAGFQSFPKDTDGFLKMMKALKEKGTPGGFALGHATGDANTWCHWLVWTFGGKLVDEKNNVAINQPGDAAGARVLEGALRHVIPGTLSWLDPNNNKAFLAGRSR